MSLVDVLERFAAHAASVLPTADIVAAAPRDELVAALERVVAVRGHLDRLSALLAARVAEASDPALGATGLAKGLGFATPEKLIQKVTGESAARAKRFVDSGRLLSDAPGQQRWDEPLADALAAGALSLEQASALREGLGAPATDATTPAWRAALSELLSTAATFDLTVEELRREARFARARLDEEAFTREEEARYRARSFTRFRRGDGMTQYTLVADPLSAATIDAALDPLLSPRTTGPRFATPAEATAEADAEEFDDRTREQKAFDAVLALLTVGANADPGMLYGSVKPEVRIVVATAELRKAAGGRPGVAQVDGAGYPVTARSILRSICTHGFIPALFDESGSALDLGRAERFFTDKQKAALAIRDGGCIYPGCDRPPGMTEAHHIVPWSEGGETNIDDGVLLCRPHHGLVHDTGAWIERDAAGAYWLRRPGGEALRLRSKNPLAHPMLG